MNKTAILALLACAGLGFAAGRSDKTAATSAQLYANQSAGPQRSEPGPATEGQPVETPDEPEPTVTWVTVAEAKASGKPILYLATKTVGCEPCNRLKALLANPISAEALSHFACVLVKDPPANHPWMRHYGVRSFPTMVFVGPAGTQPRIQSGCPDDVPSLLQFLHFMEERFEGKPPATVIADGAKTSIVNRPTLAPARPHSPVIQRGRERSVVVRRGGPGLWARITFRPGR